MDKNAELAELLGWTDASETRYYESGPSVVKQWNDCGRTILGGAARFTTDLNAFHTHVIPALKERGLMEAWAEAVWRRSKASTLYKHSGYGYTQQVDHDWEEVADLLAASPDTLTDAAIAVMKRQDDE
jgi:hypothetical protein